MAEPETYLGDLAGVRVILDDGVELPITAVLNFIGGVQATYNSATRRIDIDVAGGGGGSYPVQNGTDADTTASVNSILRMPTVTAARTVTLPASPANGDWVKLVLDSSIDFNITVGGNGKNIDDGFATPASTYVIANAGASLEFVYFSAPNVWRIL
jgi:hypothetical protein